MKRLLKKCLLFLSLIVPVAQAVHAQRLEFHNDKANCKNILGQLFHNPEESFKSLRVLVNGQEVTAENRCIFNVQENETLKIELIANAKIGADFKGAKEKAYSLKRYNLPIGYLGLRMARSEYFDLHVHIDWKVRDGQEELSLCDVLNRTVIMDRFKKLDIKYPGIKHVVPILLTLKAHIYIADKQQGE